MIIRLSQVSAGPFTERSSSPAQNVLLDTSTDLNDLDLQVSQLELLDSVSGVSQES